ncbi:MAG: flagellar biosynthetic protein FliO [Solirubrobacteraceae bacterium]|nr:flagellar biosynthetic protein FliO [Solirubrobacteraceae bacterium]
MPQLPVFRLRLHAQHLAALAFCAGIFCLLVLSTGGAYGQAATTPSKPKGEDAPLGPATQAAGEGDTTATSGDDGSSGGIVRTIVGLLIVIAVIYGVTWVLKQLKTREDDAVGAGLESRATLPLGPGRSVHLVRAGNEYLLLGVAEGAVQTLRTYTEQEARAAGFPVEDAADLLPLKDRPAQPTTFVERIRDLTVRR